MEITWRVRLYLTEMQLCLCLKKKKISYLGLLHPQCPQEPGFTFGFESYYHYYQ